MYRSMMKRLLCSPSNLHRSLILSPITTTTTTTTTAITSSSSSSPSHFSRFFSTDSNTPHPFPHQNFSPQPPIPEAQVFSETLASSSTTTASSSSSSAAAAAEEAVRHHENQRQRKGEPRRPKVEYQEEQARVLQAALRHVVRLGWSETAIVSGAREVGVSPSILGSFPRKEAALVEFFMDDCLEKLIDIIESGEDLKNLIHSERIAKLIRIRLEMQAPYISKWAQALSIQAQPMNLPTSFKQRAVLIDEILHASGDQASDIDWYVKRTVLGGVYSAAEVYMLTDNSPDFRDTWKFIDNRVKDAFDLEKTVQEAKYLAEAVGAGIGSSLQGFMKGVSPGR